MTRDSAADSGGETAEFFMVPCFFPPVYVYPHVSQNGGSISRIYSSNGSSTVLTAVPTSAPAPLFSFESESRNHKVLFWNGDPETFSHPLLKPFVPPDVVSP